MPADAAGGCVELLARVFLEIVVHGLGEWIWFWFKVSGSFCVWALTFGRINLVECHETLAGIIGTVLHTAIIGLLIRWVLATPGAAQ